VNNQITPVTSTLLRNKLGRLAIRLQQSANPIGNNNNFNTLESAVVESIKILSQFYKNLSEPGFTPVKVIPDTLPDAASFNNNFISIKDDLITIFDEFENLEGVILGEFNYMVSRLNRLNRKLKSVSSLLGDYALFANFPTKDAIFFSDSFNNLNRVEANSPLINTEQAEINQVEGIVTLPVDRQAQVLITPTEIPIINSNSNGTPGNNYEAGAQLHGTISDILDNNADTWFEYERVVSRDDGVPLILDFTINIGAPQVINFIRINPNNFGTRTQIEILSIDTSLDGKKYTSIKDDIPIAGFTIEDEENVFKLAPSTSKFAGQGLYTFTPRKSKYVRITLKQSTPYVISSYYRYAIGIRDVDIQALPYKQEGEVISTEFNANDEVRKVVVESNQNPISSSTSILASIDHFISPDNGITWHQIRPKASSGSADTTQEIPEILDFNGTVDKSIKTNNIVKTLRYKAILKRKTEGFTNNASELAQDIDWITELHTPPSTTPFTITLQQQPVDKTLKLIDPQFGSRGKEETKYNIAFGTGAGLSILLPFKPLVRDFEKDLSGSFPALIDKAPEQIYIDGILWSNGALTGNNNNYFLNYEEGKIEFGDGTNGNVVKQGSTISMVLGEERLLLSRGASHIAKLDYPTSNDKKQMEIYLVSPPKSKTQILKKGTTRHQLEPDILNNAAPYLIKFSDSNIFDSTKEKAFSDIKSGAQVLDEDGKWSLDYTNGVLYSYKATSKNTDTSVVYFYRPRTKLTESQWDFIDMDDGITNAISISDNIFNTFKVEHERIEGNVKYFNFKYATIIRGTVEFLDSNNNTPSVLANEVEYIDGHSELLGVTTTREQFDAITGISGNTNVSLSFKAKIINDTSFSATFSDQSVFIQEVENENNITNVGDYWIDRSYDTSLTGRVKVRVSENISDPGTATYSYTSSQTTLSGIYSINYKTGEVFTYNTIPSGLYVNYEYTDYRARYDIARLVPSTDWEFDAQNKKIKIKDREILKNIRTPQAVGQTSLNASKFYQASYQYVKTTRADVSELEPFFSPVLKDYALRVITKSRLV
jgi:hypothetical protein